ncbi:MAG: Glu-tRNA(Gln) amidotransferase subunit GatE [Candidatus Aenigmatarchaeota archaeon]
MNYEEIGFKCGIEIHQRLDTDKLFCDCSSRMEESPDGEVRRGLRVVPGELGEIDPAALYEFLRDREFVYKTYPTESCEVELDEEPPHEVREEALEISLQVAKMLGCEVPREIHPMRKTVIDGSNTTGFQRTMLIGLDGEMETSKGTVGVENVCLEEESAQILDREGNTVTYGLNRLGIPLVEIGTAPEIKSPEHARETAEKIGKMLRATGRVQRGIGSIRQDVNVSIEDGARIEVKGLQELDILEKTVRLEVERQASLLEVKEELKERGAEVSRDVRSVEDVFEESSSDFAENVLQGKRIKAFVLRKFGGLLAKEISSDKTFGKELSEYAEAHGLGGIVHTDEDLGEYGLEEEFEELREKLRAGDRDVVVVAAGKEGLDNAVEAVTDRAEKALEGVPEETRDSNKDGTTVYLRPLPGEERMYPETDVPSIEVSEERLKSIDIPDSLEERKKRLVEEDGLSEHLAEEILNSRFLELFEDIKGKFNMDPSTLANLLTVEVKDAKKRKGLPVEDLDAGTLEKIVRSIDGGEVPKDSFSDILRGVLEEDKDVGEALEEKEVLSDGELEKIVENVLEEKEELLDEERTFKKLMGPVMGEVGDRADGDRVSKMLQKKIKQKKD